MSYSIATSFKIKDKNITMTSSEYSAEIKTEVLQICEAFNLGSFIGLVSFKPSSKVNGYIFTQFDTETGRYDHYYRIK